MTHAMGESTASPAEVSVTVDFPAATRASSPRGVNSRSDASSPDGSKLSRPSSLQVQATGVLGSYLDMMVNKAPKQTRPWFVIDPRYAAYLSHWDFLTSLAMLFTAVFTPFEVSFLPPSRHADEPRFVMNRVVDGVFILDFILQFFIAYLQAPTMSSQAARWVFAPRAIARNYIRSYWFVLDVTSIGVALFDYLELESVAGTIPDHESGVTASNFKLLRVLRALRLVKLLRLVRASRQLHKFQVRHAVNYGMLALCASFIKVIFVCHLLACIWTLQASFHDSRLDTWLGTTAGRYCWECRSSGAYGGSNSSLNGADTAGLGSSTDVPAVGHAPGDDALPMCPERRHLISAPERSGLEYARARARPRATRSPARTYEAPRAHTKPRARPHAWHTRSRAYDPAHSQKIASTRKAALTKPPGVGKRRRHQPP